MKRYNINSSFVSIEGARVLELIFSFYSPQRAVCSTMQKITILSSIFYISIKIS